MLDPRDTRLLGETVGTQPRSSAELYVGRQVWVSAAGRWRVGVIVRMLRTRAEISFYRSQAAPTPMIRTFGPHSIRIPNEEN